MCVAGNVFISHIYVKYVLQFSVCGTYHFNGVVYINMSVICVCRFCWVTTVAEYLFILQVFNYLAFSVCTDGWNGVTDLTLWIFFGMYVKTAGWKGKSNLHRHRKNVGTLMFHFFYLPSFFSSSLIHCLSFMTPNLPTSSALCQDRFVFPCRFTMWNIFRICESKKAESYFIAIQY